MIHKEESDMSTHSTNQANIEQLRLEIAAVAEEMRRPPPTMARAVLLPFSIGVVFAMTTFIVVLLVARLI